MTTDQRLAEIRERCGKATPLEKWKCSVRCYENIDPDPGDGWDGCFYCTGPDHKGPYEPDFNSNPARDIAEADRQFIAHSREDIPFLLRLLDAERAKVERLSRDFERIQKYAEYLDSAIREHVGKTIMEREDDGSVCWSGRSPMLHLMGLCARVAKDNAALKGGE